MAVLSLLLSPYTLLLLPILLYILPYIKNRALISIPGPPLARFSNLWLLYQSRLARRSFAVDAAHKTYGPLVRVQPNHVSVADDQHIATIYGHGNGFTKPDFYDAFVSIHRGLFNVRDRAQHSRKRKIVSNTFSKASVGQFEPYIHANLDLFVKQWDRISDEGAKSGKGGFGHIDALHWFNYLAFDVIGDLAFGAPFGMLEKGADVAEVRETPDSKPKYAPAVEVLNRRGEVSATVGCFPQMKPYAKWFPDPFFSKGIRAVENLAGIAVARVRMRLNAEKPSGRKDLLARLMEGKDESGQPLGREELTAEALTQLIAGSDTTSNTSCAILFYVLSTPHVLPKLREELDREIPKGESVPIYDMVKEEKCPYLDKVIREGMRMHSTSSMGLPREVPAGPGVEIHGHHFPPGSILSVPAYTIHHSKEVWGDDADEFKPERWNKDVLTDRQKAAFIPFSHGPRGCVGRNVAEMELALILGTTFRRYDFELLQKTLEVREGFLKKPVALNVGIRKRAEI